jgi:hypothetical protein
VITIVMGLDQHRAQITAEWVDTETGESSRAWVAHPERRLSETALWVTHKPTRECPLRSASRAERMGEAARENDIFRRFLELPPATTRPRCSSSIVHCELTTAGRRPGYSCDSLSPTR